MRVPLTADDVEARKRLEDTLHAEAALGPFEIRRMEFVGPQVGRELQLSTL